MCLICSEIKNRTLFSIVNDKIFFHCSIIYITNKLLARFHTCMFYYTSSSKTAICKYSSFCQYTPQLSYDPKSVNKQNLAKFIYSFLKLIHCFIYLISTQNPFQLLVINTKTSKWKCLTKLEIILADIAGLSRDHALGKDAICAGILLISF